jgi:hypothetical protein
MPELLDDSAVRAHDDAPVTTALVSPDALQGLEILVDLFDQTCEMMNRGVLSIETALNALHVAGEAWVPVSVEAPPADPPADVAEAEPVPEEHLFNGIPVTIMKLSRPLCPDAGRRAANQDQLGYGRLGDRSAILFRPANSEDAVPLVDAPIEARLRALRAVPRLLAAIENRVPAPLVENRLPPPPEPDPPVDDLPSTSLSVAS